jgi:hypothetical protein
MHCLDELHIQLVSLALIICYILIPCSTYLGTSYIPLSSPLYQLSILLLLDYGWYIGLGLRCERSRCVLAWVQGTFLLDVFWRERSDRLLENACLEKMRSGLLPERRVEQMELGSARSRPLRTDRKLSLPQMTFTVQTAHLVLGGGAGWDS